MHLFHYIAEAWINTIRYVTRYDDENIERFVTKNLFDFRIRNKRVAAGWQFETFCTILTYRIKSDLTCNLWKNFSRQFEMEIYFTLECVSNVKEITSYHRMHQRERKSSHLSLCVCESIHIIMPHQAARGDDLIVKHLMWWHDLKSNYGHHHIYSDPQISFQANHANRPQFTTRTNFNFGFQIYRALHLSSYSEYICFVAAFKHNFFVICTEKKG